MVRVRENLLISFFRSAWTGEGEQKNNSKFTDPNHPILDSVNKGGCLKIWARGGGGQRIRKLCGRHMYKAPEEKKAYFRHQIHPPSSLVADNDRIRGKVEDGVGRKNIVEKEQG